MKFWKKFLITAVIIAVIAECAWYIWLDQKKAKLERSFETESNKAIDEMILQTNAPLLKQTQIIEGFTQWFNKETQNQYRLILDFVAENGTYDPKQTYLYDDTALQTNHLEYNKKALKYVSKVNDVAVVYFVEHQTGHYYFVIVKMLSRGRKMVVSRMTKKGKSAIAKSFTNEQNAIADDMTKILDAPSYILNMIYGMLHSKLSIELGNPTKLWLSLKRHLISLQTKNMDGSQKTGQEFSQFSDTFHQEMQQTEARLANSKRRLPWYSLFLLFFFLTNFFLSLKRGLKWLIGVPRNPEKIKTEIIRLKEKKNGLKVLSEQVIRQIANNSERDLNELQRAQTLQKQESLKEYLLRKLRGSSTEDKRKYIDQLQQKLEQTESRNRATNSQKRWIGHEHELESLSKRILTLGSYEGTETLLAELEKLKNPDQLIMLELTSIQSQLKQIQTVVFQ